MQPFNTYFLIFLPSYFVFAVNVRYEVPPALIEPLYPYGLRVSIPDLEGITLFAFHGNVNEDFEMGHEAGQMAQDVLRKKDGRWTYINRNIKLKIGDTIYYWLYVIKDGIGYEKLFQSYSVTGFSDDTEMKAGIVDLPISTKAPETVSPSIVVECKQSETVINGEHQCKGSLIFNSQFSQGINKNWSHFVQIEQDSEFVVFDSKPANSFAESNSLVIKPTLLDDAHGKGFTLKGPLDLASRCSSSVTTACYKIRNAGPNILPPIVSARLTTKNSFSFRYGVVEIKAKLPHGDWVVPEIWLLPKSYSSEDYSGKMIIASSFGNDELSMNGKEIGSKHLFCGLQVGCKDMFFKAKRSGFWSDDFHIFKMTWAPDHFIFYADGDEIGQWTNRTDQPFLTDDSSTVDKNAPFNQEYYLVLGLHVGGITDFPDGVLNKGVLKPWKNTHPARVLNFYQDTSNWHSTWNGKTKMMIEYVKVWAL